MIEVVEVPYIKVGNRRALTRMQLVEDPYLMDFVQRFSHCFEESQTSDVFFYIEPEEVKS